MKKNAFTLFEVLLALLIIGIIVVITIPAVHDNALKKSYAAQLNNVHRALVHAINQVLIDERQVSLAETSLADSAGDFMKKYLNIQVDCGKNNHSNCVADTYKSLNGLNSISSDEIFDGSLYCVKTTSGPVICMSEMSADSNNVHGDSLVIVDINGKKVPNMNGRDLFQFEIYSDGKIGNGYKPQSEKTSGETCKGNAGTAGYGGSCFQKVMADGWKMDY